jgi:hypothetical protein
MRFGIGGLLKLKLFPLSCNGKLCPWTLNYVHVTCLFCRSRRRWLKKFIDPPYWIEYIYTASIRDFTVTSYKQYVGKVPTEVRRRDGKPFIIQQFCGVKIDPRGHYTSLRCAAIIVLDCLSGWLNLYRMGGEGRPLSELCELMANYP